jgi:hypothetical protein
LAQVWQDQPPKPLLALRCWCMFFVWRCLWVPLHSLGYGGDGLTLPSADGYFDHGRIDEY